MLINHHANRKYSSKRNFIPIYILFFLAPPSGLAQNSDGIYIEVSECLEFSTDALRLACFEEASAQVLEKPVSVIDTPVSSESELEVADATPQPAALTKIDDFGLNSPISRIVENELNGNEELIDRIVSLQEREPSKWLIGLEGGQVWYQVNSKRFRLREGMEIRIFPSPFASSYRLSSSTMKGHIQVKRIK